MLLNKYNEDTTEFKLENIIAIFCFDDSKNSIFRMKENILKSEKIYEVYNLETNIYDYKQCEKRFLIRNEKELENILKTNFENIRTFDGQLYINKLTEINLNGIKKEEAGIIYIKNINQNLLINYGLKDKNHIGFYDCKYQFKLK